MFVQELGAENFAGSMVLAFGCVMKSPSLINEIATKIIDRIKAELNDGVWEYQRYGAVWEGRAEAGQQDKTEKQDAIEVENGWGPIDIE